MSAEHEVQLDLAVVLPGVGADDGCLDRLESALQNHRGLQRAHLERVPGAPMLCLHYDPDVLSLSDVQRMVVRAGARLLNRYRHELLALEGMDCSDCASVIEHSLTRLDGVLAARVNYAAETMRVEYDTHRIGRGVIERRLQSLGYAVPAGRLRVTLVAYRELLLVLAAGALLLGGWVGSRLLDWAPLVATPAYLVAYVLAGWDTARHAWHTLRARAFDTDVLMVVAALGAAVTGEFAEGALLLVLFGLGHALEARVLDRARAAVRALAALAPKTALARRGAEEIEIPVDQLALQDAIIVRPGARVPVDGVVLTGTSAVDQAPVTGESVPVEKGAGATVFAGSVNGEGALEVRVTRLAKDSTLARVMRMVEDAQAQKSPTQQLIQRFEGVFVPGVLAVTGLVIVLAPLWGLPLRESFLRAMTLLVAASPCALALGTPAAVLAGVAQAARHGVLIKGGVHLENLGRLRAVAFDKTGTLTHGRPEVTNVITFDSADGSGGPDPDRLLALAAAIEQRSGHPLAQAAIRAARAKGLALPAVGEVESLTARGLRAQSNGAAVLIGNQRLMEESGVPILPAVLSQLADLEAQGKSLILVTVEHRLQGVIAVADTLRPEAAATMRALRQLGIRETVMLTGDNSRVAQAIAREVGLTEVRADLLPEDKLGAIQALVARFGAVGMVGDGVNDAPALANATVGIAMGGAATDVAIETADVALMAADLSKLPFAVSLGRATRRVVLQNLTLSLAVIAILVTASLAGLARMGLAVAIHEGSTLLVALNAMRLLAHRPR